MSNRNRRLRLIAAAALGLPCAVLCSRSPVAAQTGSDPLSLGVEVSNALDELHGAYQRVVDAQTALEHLERGEPIGVDGGGDWATLADEFRAAADDLTAAPLPTDVDATRYAISLDELTKCKSRPASIRKLDGLLDELTSAERRGRDAADHLAAADLESRKSDEALHLLIGVSEELASTPAYTMIFGDAADWYELDQDVHPALSDLRAAISERRARLDTALDDVATRRSNLDANLQYIRTLLPFASVVATPSAVAITGGESQSVTVIVKDTRGKKVAVKPHVSYHSSNEKVALVGHDGLIKGRRPGKAKVLATVSLPDGHSGDPCTISDSVSVTVAQAPAYGCDQNAAEHGTWTSYLHNPQSNYRGICQATGHDYCLAYDERYWSWDAFLRECPGAEVYSVANPSGECCDNFYFHGNHFSGSSGYYCCRQQ
jgi:hypothetical protein